jgi:hypothetical protein
LNELLGVTPLPLFASNVTVDAVCANHTYDRPAENPQRKAGHTSSVTRARIAFVGKAHIKANYNQGDCDAYNKRRKHRQGFG